MHSVRARPARVALLGVTAGALLVVGLASFKVVQTQPSASRSVEVVTENAIVRAEPSSHARLRGRLRAGQRLGFVSRADGIGCGGEWIQLGYDAFVCERDVDVTSLPPDATRQPPLADGDLLPYRYVFAKRDGTRTFRHPADAGTRPPAKLYRKGFSFPVVSRMLFRGEPFLQSWTGLWVRESQINEATPSPFEGVSVSSPDELTRIGWAVRDVPVYADPFARGAPIRTVAKQQRITIRDVRDGWIALDDGGFVDAAAIRRPELEPPPAGVGGSERWIDVDLSHQVITFYEGRTPVRTSLVSAGTYEEDRRTPIGDFRIRHKLALGTMDRTDFPDPEEDYSLEGIPWVQYFQGSNALHAAFWHRDFGRQRSHGCVNLAPRDALFAWHFTRPELPPGWMSIRTHPEDRPTVVHVRRD